MALAQWEIDRSKLEPGSQEDESMKALLKAMPALCLLATACQVPAGDAGSPSPADEGTPEGLAAEASVLTAFGGHLVRESVRGDELLRTPLPVAGPVVRVFGQSRTSGDALYAVHTPQGL